MELLELVLLSQQGDRRAFTKLLCQVSVTIREVARKHFKCEQMIDEAVNLSNLKVWSNIGSFDPKKSTGVRSWVYTVSQNCCRDLIRYEKRRKWDYIDDVLVYKASDEEVVYADVKSDVKNPEELLYAKECVSQLYDLLDEILNERQKNLVIAMYIDGKSQKEIAEEYGLSSVNVGAIVCRAMALLKKSLKNR
jgi:RNA polymerase sigma-70 factor, ECF subfamily